VHDERAARNIATAIGPPWRTARLTAIGDGFASDAWLLATPDGERGVLRVANGRGLTDVTYEMEHVLMDRLHAGGASVPRPIIGSWQVPGWGEPAFSLTSWAPGEPLRPEAVPRSGPAIAAFLDALRAVPFDGGYGPLQVGPGGSLRGAAPERATGLIRWAERPFWPLDGSRLMDHPAIGEHAALASAMEACADVVRSSLLTGPVAILHSDLHEGNVLDDDGALTVIDFGEALVGPVAWDIAAVGFFMDWTTADAVANHDAASLEDAARIGLAFGAYRWHLSREHAFDDDEHDHAFLAACLSRMGR
jgi:Ser/Thr protein kinase RdoA (MazF antagonist)